MCHFLNSLSGYIVDLRICTTYTYHSEAPMADAELARQRAMDRERQKAHDQKMRGEIFFCSYFSLLRLVTTIGWLSREKKQAASE